MESAADTDRELVHSLHAALASAGRPLKVMEICGTHTMAIARGGLRSVIGKGLELISGPGCPVCVTDNSYLDQAVALASGDYTARIPAPIIATYGDMIRVPGRRGSLAEARAHGADVRAVYSANQAVELAIKNPGRQVVFLGVGFETTTPGTALALRRARAEGIVNFSTLASHKIILPAMEALLSSPEMRVDGFLCPGHVSVILGYEAYNGLVERYGRPCVAAGFEVRQVLTGLVEIVRQIAEKRPRACTVYPAVKAEGNRTALTLMDETFQTVDVPWRGLGVIPGSGLAPRESWAEYDAARRFGAPLGEPYEDPRCRCGKVLAGLSRPWDCPLFGRVCTPADPVGPCMVSSEGACAAAYKYERHGSGRAARE